MRDNYRRVLVYFTKRGEAASLSHLELNRAFDESLRGSGLPVRMTEGENRRVKMSFPTALPQGMESLLEAMEIQVQHGPTLREVCERLDESLPEGFGVLDADALYSGERWRVTALEYEVSGDPDALPAGEELEAFLAREEIPVERRGKEVDLRPLLLRAERTGDALDLSIAWADSGTQYRFTVSLVVGLLCA